MPRIRVRIPGREEPLDITPKVKAKRKAHMKTRTCKNNKTGELHEHTGFRCKRGNKTVKSRSYKGSEHGPVAVKSVRPTPPPKTRRPRVVAIAKKSPYPNP